MYVEDKQGRLSNARRTATGGFRVDATLARTGVMVYGDQRHYNPPELLAAVTDAVAEVPVTYRHPKKDVTPETYRELSAGHVVGTPTFKEDMIHATLAILDAELIQAIDAGECEEVSMGYYVELENEPGETEDGQAYDAKRVGIRWNHIAVVPQGRAGAAVRLMLDSEKSMITLDQKTLTGDAAQAAVDLLVAEKKRLNDEVESLKAKLTEATSPEAIEREVKKCLDAKAKAEAAAGRKAAVQKAYPTLVLDGKSQEYVDAIHDVLTQDSGVRELKLGTPTVPAETKLSPRERMLAANRSVK